MKQDTQGAVLLVVGLVTVHLTISGGFMSYVRAGLRIPLLIAGVFLVIVGIASAFGGSPTTRDAHGHGPGGARIGLMMIVFVVTIYLIAPAPLGAFAAGRGDQNRAIAGADSVEVPPLAEPTQGFIDMTLTEFISRALHYPDTIEGVPVRLVGFVSPDPTDPTTYRLTRFTFACCAADATPLQVQTTGAPKIPSIDQWLIVEGVWTGATAGSDDLGPLPVLEISNQTPTEEPSQPYEY